VNFTKLKGKKILLVEDDRLTFLFIKQVFKFSDTDIDHVSTGKEAFAKISERTYDLILMDIQLPDQRGTDLAISIRKLNHSIPIIAQTASRNPDEKENAIDAGCTDFILKPYKPTELYAIIEKYL
jgi:DNA-binding response OmpR family regulator